MGYYLGAPHVDTPLKGVRTNLLFLTAGNAATTFLSGPALYNNAEADRLYPEGEIFNPGQDAVSKNWILYLEKRFVFFCSFSACVLTFFCRYGFLLTNPDAFEEKRGLFSVFPFRFNRTAVGDILTFESWNAIHCNPIPKAGESRIVIFWYSYEKDVVVDGIDVDHQLNPWTLHSMVHPKFEANLVNFNIFFIHIFLHSSPE
jgi:hypothetical protein